MYILNNNLSDNLASTTPAEKYNMAKLPDTIESNYKAIMPELFWSIKNKSTQSSQSNYETLRAYIAKSLELINKDNINYTLNNNFNNFTDKLNLFNKYIGIYEAKTGIITQGSKYILSAPDSEMNAVAKDLTKITLEIDNMINEAEFSKEKLNTDPSQKIKTGSDIIKGVDNNLLIFGGIALVAGIYLLKK
jgi:hypothetical protein